MTNIIKLQKLETEIQDWIKNKNVGANCETHFDMEKKICGVTILFSHIPVDQVDLDLVEAMVKYLRYEYSDIIFKWSFPQLKSEKKGE